LYIIRKNFKSLEINGMKDKDLMKKEQGETEDRERKRLEWV
jgi:hypothetical protein